MFTYACMCTYLCMYVYLLSLYLSFKYTNDLSISRDHEMAALSEAPLGNKHSGEVNSLVIEVCAFNGQRYRC